MITDLKPIGAFIENTIRPLIDEMKWFLNELEHKGIRITESNISKVINCLGNTYIKVTIIKLFQYLIITGMVCFSVLKIYQL